MVTIADPQIARQRQRRRFPSWKLHRHTAYLPPVFGGQSEVAKGGRKQRVQFGSRPVLIAAARSMK
jgi:hypothetical protein